MTVNVVGLVPERSAWSAAKAMVGCDWAEVDEGAYWDALEMLPPIWAPGGFMFTEAWTHDGGVAIRLYVTTVKGRHYARLVPENKCSEARAELLEALAVKGGAA